MTRVLWQRQFVSRRNDSRQWRHVCPVDLKFKLEFVGAKETLAYLINDLIWLAGSILILNDSDFVTDLTPAGTYCLESERPRAFWTMQSIRMIVLQFPGSRKLHLLRTGYTSIRKHLSVHSWFINRNSSSTEILEPVRTLQWSVLKGSRRKCHFRI